MKIGGKKVSIEDRIVEVFIPTGSNDGIMFKCKPVRNMDQFEKLCPAPKAPEMFKPGGTIEYDTENPDYKKAMEVYERKQHAFFMLESMSETEDLEWDTVDLEDSSTWENFQEELMSSFTAGDVGRITNGVLEANSLSPEAIEAAKKNFLAGKAVTANDQ